MQQKVQHTQKNTVDGVYVEINAVGQFVVCDDGDGASLLGIAPC
jgi:hypothetical protein